MPGITKYTRCPDDTGWLKIRLTSPTSDVSVCEYTKVELTREANGRQFFKVADGSNSYVGQEASLTSAHARQFLSDLGPQGAATVEVKYLGPPQQEYSPVRQENLLQQWATETFNGVTAKVTLNSVWDRSFSPIPAGTHSILAPDFSHGNISTIRYAHAVSGGMLGHDVWFPIGLNGAKVGSSRYIHVGHLSEGCVTQYELTKWTDIYKYLISHRVPGSMGRLVGSLIVNK